MASKVRVDEIDVNIIRALQKDARVSFADIVRIVACQQTR